METENIKKSAVITLGEEYMFIGLPVSCLFTQKKKMIKVRAYLLLDMQKKKKN
jgi:hypothetical protein